MKFRYIYVFKILNYCVHRLKIQSTYLNIYFNFTKNIILNSCLFKTILIKNFNWHLQNRYYTVNLQFNIKILNFIEYANGQNRSKDAFKGNGRLTVCVLFAIFWKEIMFTTPFRSSYHVNIEAKRGFKIWDRIILTAQK